MSLESRRNKQRTLPRYLDKVSVNATKGTPYMY